MSTPENYKLIYPEHYIQYRIKEISLIIDQWAAEVYEETKKPVLATCLLQGGVMFFSDLIREITSPIEYGFIRPKSYEKNSQLDDVSILLNDINPQDRTILLVDDIVDTGRTVDNLSTYLLEGGAFGVGIATLIERLSPDRTFTRPDWSCIRHEGAEWFVGYGMDDYRLNRNLKDIYTLEQE